MTALISSRPWGRIRPQNRSHSPTAWNRPPARPTLAPLKARIPAVGMQARMPIANAVIDTWMLLNVTSAANWLAGSEE